MSGSDASVYEPLQLQESYLPEGNLHGDIDDAKQHAALVLRIALQVLPPHMGGNLTDRIQAAAVLAQIVEVRLREARENRK